MPGVKAEFVTDEHGQIVFITDLDSCADRSATVGLHPMQLRYLAERFAGLEPQPQPFATTSASLIERLVVLADHIEDLYTALLTSRAPEYTDMSHEMACARALHSIAQAFICDLPGATDTEPAQRPQASTETATEAQASKPTRKASTAPVESPAGQMGLEV